MRYQEIQEACWTGYRQAGMKKKGDRQVPNCVPVNESKQKFILYFNNKPVATYDTEAEAEYQGRLIQKRVPGTEFEIKQEVCTLTPVQLEENLRDWFKEKWVRFGPDGRIRGDCARGSSKEGKPKCLPRSKAYALGKKKRAAAGAKKRREDPNPERRGPAKNVATKVKEANVKRPQPYHDKDWHKKLSPEDLRKLTGPNYKKNKTPKVREDAVKDLTKDLKNPHSYDAIDHMMQSIARKSGITGKQLHDRFVDKHGVTPDEYIKRKGGK